MVEHKVIYAVVKPLLVWGPKERKSRGFPDSEINRPCKEMQALRAVVAEFLGALVAGRNPIVIRRVISVISLTQLMDWMHQVRLSIESMDNINDLYGPQDGMAGSVTRRFACLSASISHGAARQEPDPLMMEGLSEYTVLRTLHDARSPGTEIIIHALKDPDSTCTFFARMIGYCSCAYTVS